MQPKTFKKRKVTNKHHLIFWLRRPLNSVITCSLRPFHDENTWTFGSGGTSAERWRDFASSSGGMVTVFFVGGGLGWEMKTNSSPKNMCGECIFGAWLFFVCYIGPKVTKALKKMDG